jgi:Tfp pilus assembly protein PilN
MLDRFIKSKSVAGVEVVLVSDGSIVFNATVLVKNMSAVEIEISKAGLLSYEELKSFLPAKIPVVLVLNGKGIIHKKVNCLEADTDNTLLQKVFPNTNTDDFYIQKVRIDTTSAFVSVIRKSVLDDLLKDFQALNFTVVSCSFGPFCLAASAPLLQNYSGDFYFEISGYKLKILEGVIESYQVVPVTGQTNVVVLDGKEMDASLVLSFSVAFQYLIEDKSFVINIPSLLKAKEELRQKEVFHFIGWALLITFLTLLMVNYFVFNYYWTKKNEISNKVSLNNAALLRYDVLEKEVAEKQSFFEKTGMLELSRTSYYADQIAKSLPNTLQLSQLNIAPLIKKENAEEAISFDSKTIIIAGNCKRSNELNKWIKIIKSKKWVAEVTLLNYTQDKSKDEGEFSIELKIN